MDLTQDVLLPLLLAAIVANSAIIAVVFLSGRIGKGKRMAATGGAGSTSGPSAVDRTLASSYVDRSLLASWPSDRTTPAATAGGGEAAPQAGASASDGGAVAFDAGTVGLEAGTADADPVDAPAAVTGTDPFDEGPTEHPDPLTGLPDAAAFQRLVADEEARMQRYHRPATVVLIELDGLDRLVERLGLDAGDRIVPALADTIRRLARGSDHVARLAPGRFGVLLPETDEVAAINYIERVRRACELWLESGAIALRLAIGWSGTTGEPALHESQRIALDRMYVELRRGGRRVEAEAALRPTNGVAPTNGVHARTDVGDRTAS